MFFVEHEPEHSTLTDQSAWKRVFLWK